MKLFDWRTANQLTLSAMAARLGLQGVNPGRTLHRIETGEREARADLAARIVAATGGEVGPSDLLATRMEWLNRQRPDGEEPSAADAAPRPEREAREATS